MGGWKRMSRRQHVVVLVSAAVQLGLAAVAGADLARRSPGQVRGPKWRWALLMSVNFFGPLAYLRWGRVGAGPAGGPGGKAAGDSPVTP